MKGISPLIAAVLLIAFTMAIAGIMATWATSFTEETFNINLNIILLTILIIFPFSMLIAQGDADKDDIALKGIDASVEYLDVSKNIIYTLSSYGVNDPLGPGVSQWVLIQTGDATKPIKIEVTAKNCPDSPASLNF